MQLTSIKVDRFRNLKRIDLALPRGLTLVAGGNGQGKTGFLEATYLLGTGRSFRTRSFGDLVAWDGGPMRVVGRVSSRKGEAELTVAAESGGERQLFVNQVPRGIEEFLGRFDVVDLSAGRMGVLRGAPEERRRFIDRGIVGLDPAYLRVIGEFRRVLQQRNALLRRGSRGGGPSELDAWDDRWVVAARELHLRRREYAERLGEEIGSIAPGLLGDGQSLRLRLRPSPPELEEAAADQLTGVLADRLARCRGRDLELRHTSEGPHRDELLVELDGVDLRRFGSAGQVRSAMIVLKLGKLSLLRAERGEAPVFLMDDFDTDLDEARMVALIDHLNDAGLQSVVATSKETWAARTVGAELKLRMIEGEAQIA